MEKDLKNEESNIESKNEDRIYILNKIKYKPIILEKIFSFSLNRPYILLDMISNNKILKKSMKKVFDNTKVNNDLSEEFNNSLNNYIKYRKGYEKLVKKCDEIILNNFNDKYKSIEKPEFLEFDLNISRKFKKKKISLNVKTLKEEYPDLYEELIEFGEDDSLKLFLEHLRDKNEIELLLEAIILNGDMSGGAV